MFPSTHSAKTFTLSYHDLEGISDFLIQKSRYDESVEKNFEVGEKVIGLYSDDVSYTGTVASTTADSSDPWEMYVVKWEDGTQESLSPWEIQQRNRKKSKAPMEVIPKTGISSPPPSLPLGL